MYLLLFHSSEIIEYAASIGVDIDKEQHLLWIAREGINAPLPENWKPWYDHTFCISTNINISNIIAVKLHGTHL